MGLSDSSLTILGSLKVDHLRILAALVTALLDFHRSAHHILHGLHGNMQSRQVLIQGRGKSITVLKLFLSISTVKNKMMLCFNRMV